MEKFAKRLRFENVASNRVQKCLDVLRLLRNCANRGNYEYTTEDVDHMFTEIIKAVKETRTAYLKELEKADAKEFKF